MTAKTLRKHETKIYKYVLTDNSFEIDEKNARETPQSYLFASGVPIDKNMIGIVLKVSYGYTLYLTNRDDEQAKELFRKELRVRANEEVARHNRELKSITAYCDVLKYGTAYEQ